MTKNEKSVWGWKIARVKVWYKTEQGVSHISHEVYYVTEARYNLMKREAIQHAHEHHTLLNDEVINITVLGFVDFDCPANEKSNEKKPLIIQEIDDVDETGHQMYECVTNDNEQWATSYIQFTHDVGEYALHIYGYQTYDELEQIMEFIRQLNEKDKERS